MLQRDIDAKLKSIISDKSITTTQALANAVAKWDSETYNTNDFSTCAKVENQILFFCGRKKAIHHTRREIFGDNSWNIQNALQHQHEPNQWGLFIAERQCKDVGISYDKLRSFNAFIKDLLRSYNKLLTLYLNSDIMSKRFIMETDELDTVGWQIYNDIINKIEAIKLELKYAEIESKQCEFV